MFVPCISSPRAARVFAAGASLLLALAVAAHAQVADPRFPIVDGRVFASATDGNTLWIGGQFSRVAPNTGHFAAVDTSTGALVSPFARIDGVVRAVASDGTGGWYVGGDFHSVSGKPREHLVHVLADGSLAAWNPGTDGPVYAIVPFGGRVIVAGSFTQAGGVARSNVASFESGSGVTDGLVANTDSVVYALCLKGGVLYLGGRFNQVNGTPRANLAAVHAGSGAVQAFDAGVTGPAFGFPSVTAIAATSTTVYAGGVFAGFGGQPRRNLAAADAATGLATAWDPAGATAPYVAALATDGTRLYVGGGFATLAGQSRANLAAFSATTGALDAWNPGVNGQVLALDLRPGRVAIGGSFTTAGGATRGSVAELDATSGAPTAFDPGAYATVRALAHADVLGTVKEHVAIGGDALLVGGVARANLAAIGRVSMTATAWNPGTDGFVNALALDGTRLYVGGEFTQVGGQPRTRLACVESGAGTVTAWTPGAPNDRIEALATSGAKVYAVGGFTQVGGVPRAHAAAFDVTSGALSAWNPGPDNWTNAVCVVGGRVFLGGMFNSVGGLPRVGFAAVDSLSGTPLPWVADAQNVVEAIADGGAGRVYVGGWFTVFGGLPRNRIACFDTTTGTVTSWNPDASAPVTCFAPAGSTVYAGGAFTTMGGGAVGAVAQLDAASGSPGTYDPALFYWPWTLQVVGTNVYVGGDVYNVGALPVNGLAKLMPADAIAPVMTVTAPTGGGIAPGVVPIRWTKSDPQPVRWVDIDYSSTGLGGPWKPLAIAYPNTGRYDWYVMVPAQPAARAVAANGYIRVTGTDLSGNAGSDTNDAPFYIIGSGGVLGQGSPLFARVFPNPVRPSSRISFGVPSRGPVRVGVFDLQGRLVAPLVDGELEAGPHEAPLPARLGPGLYFLKVSAGGASTSRRFVILD